MGASEHVELGSMIDQLKDNDVKIKIQIANAAQKELAEDPKNKEKLAKYEHAMRELRKISPQSAGVSTKNFKSRTEVLEYLQNQGIKIGKTTLGEDIRKGILKKQSDKSFSFQDVNIYAINMKAKQQPLADDIMERAKRKEEAEIRIKEGQAELIEKKLGVYTEKYILKTQANAENAAKIVVLDYTIKNNIEAQISSIMADVIQKGHKDIMKYINTQILVQRLHELVDFSLNTLSNKHVQYDIELPDEPDPATE